MRAGEQPGGELHSEKPLAVLAGGGQQRHEVQRCGGVGAARGKRCKQLQEGVGRRARWASRAK